MDRTEEIDKYSEIRLEEERGASGPRRVAIRLRFLDSFALPEMVSQLEERFLHQDSDSD